MAAIRPEPKSLTTGDEMFCFFCRDTGRVKLDGNYMVCFFAPFSSFFFKGDQNSRPRLNVFLLEK